MEPKEALVHAICAEIGVPMIPLGPGSKEKKAVFEAIVERLRLSAPAVSKPGLARWITEFGGATWDQSCESTGDTITAAGLTQVLVAVRSIQGTKEGVVLAPSVLGAPYVTASGGVDAPAAQLLRDWDKLDAATREHADLQNKVADVLRELGVEPLSPGTSDPAFDIGWWTDERFTVCEIKSTVPENAVQQVRLGLGQLLEYRFLLQRRLASGVHAVLVVTAAGEVASGVCGSAGVLLLQRKGLSDGLRATMVSS